MLLEPQWRQVKWSSMIWGTPGQVGTPKTGEGSLWYRLRPGGDPQNREGSLWYGDPGIWAAPGQKVGCCYDMGNPQNRQGILWYGHLRSKGHVMTSQVAQQIGWQQGKTPSTTLVPYRSLRLLICLMPSWYYLHVHLLRFDRFHNYTYLLN